MLSSKKFYNLGAMLLLLICTLYSVYLKDIGYIFKEGDLTFVPSSEKKGQF